MNDKKIIHYKIMKKFGEPGGRERRVCLPRHSLKFRGSKWSVKQFYIIKL